MIWVTSRDTAGLNGTDFDSNVFNLNLNLNVTNSHRSLHGTTTWTPRTLHFFPLHFSCSIPYIPPMPRPVLIAPRRHRL